MKKTRTDKFIGISHRFVLLIHITALHLHQLLIEALHKNFHLKSRFVINRLFTILEMEVTQHNTQFRIYDY